MDRAFHVYKGEIQYFCLETPKLQKRLEDTIVDGRIVLQCILTKFSWGGGERRILLFQVREQSGIL